MNVAVELYLRDQVVTGEVYIGERRPLDRFNNLREHSLIVHRVTARGLHDPGGEVHMASARFRKARILLAVPHDSPAGPGRTELWVRKREIPVQVAVGPFLVTGTMHVPPNEAITLEEIGDEPDLRAFIPITSATMRAFAQPELWRQHSVVFLLRAAIDYLSLARSSDESGE